MASKPKKKKLYCQFKSAWKKQTFTVKEGEREKSFSGEVLSGIDGDEQATCTVCRLKFSVRHGGANDVVKHFSSINHSRSMSARTSNLATFGFGQSDTAKRAREKQDEHQLQVQRAEALFVQFVAEHNLTFRTGDHFTKLVKNMFPDSEVANEFQCSRTKTSVLTRYGNGKFYQDKLDESLTSTTPVFYSLLIDESNDRGVEAKDLVIMLRFFDNNVMKAVTRFFDLPTANNGTAAAIFEKVNESLTSRGVLYENLICFNSDTCNTMKGQRNGVVRHLRDKQPNLLDLGCICHLENLALKAAMKSLYINIDSLMVDINTHFYLSVKRKEEFKEFCDFVNITYKRIIGHVETRWLSLLRVIARVLELWPALVSYFCSHSDADKRGRIRMIKEQLNDETKLYLLFLNHLLPTVNAFNIAFQATNYTTIHLLHVEMKKLTKRILRYFVDVNAIDLDDITKTPFEDKANQLGDDQVEVGDEARSLADSLRDDGMEPEVGRFFRHVRLFYCKFVSTVLKKFPFHSTLLSDLRVLNPSERRTYKDFPNAVIRLANEFPQVKLIERLGVLKTEAIDFQMADEEDLPREESVDSFWAAMHDIKEIGSATLTYSNLLILVRALLALPASNADSERCFSMVRKIDTEDRSHLQRSTVASLLCLKLNVDAECHDFKPPTDLLKLNKLAVREYNAKHGSYPTVTSMDES